MKKPMALVPSLGLVMLGAAPVMAAGQTFALVPSPGPVAGAPLISNPSKIDASGLSAIKIPEPPGFGMLGDEELEERTGEGLVGAVAGGIVSGVSYAVSAASGTAAVTYVSSGSVDWHAVGVAAVGGFVGGFVRGAIRGAIVGP